MWRNVQPSFSKAKDSESLTLVQGGIFLRKVWMALKIKAVCSFTTWGVSNPATESKSPEDLSHHLSVVFGIKFVFMHVILPIFRVVSELREVTISFVMSVSPSVRPSVCLSVRMEQLGSKWTDFHEIWYLHIFRKLVGKIQVLLKSDKNTGYSNEDLYTFMIRCHSIFLRMRIFQTKFVKKIKTCILCLETVYRKSCLMRQCGKISYSQTDHRWQYNTAHAP
jgi:hypothetical protein